jgi:hypothetical protein
MGRNRTVIWIALAAIAFADAVLCCAAGLRFSGWSLRLSLTAAIAVTGLFYHCRRPDARIAGLAHWIVAWIAFSITGAILTYLAASHGAAWSDEILAGLDRRLGFDWASWFLVRQSLFRPQARSCYRLYQPDAADPVVGVLLCLARLGRPQL